MTYPGQVVEVVHWTPGLPSGSRHVIVHEVDYPMGKMLAVKPLGGTMQPLNNTFWAWRFRPALGEVR